MKYVKFLVVPLLYVALAFMIIGGCGGSSGGGGNGQPTQPPPTQPPPTQPPPTTCPDVSGMSTVMFVETSNTCGEPLEPPFPVTTNCTQEDATISLSGTAIVCPLNCNFTEEDGLSIDTTGTISEDGMINLSGTAGEFVLSCSITVTALGDLIEGMCDLSEVETCDRVFNIPGDTGSCVGLCGELGPEDCFCDEFCVEMDDCCSDFVEVCEGPADTLDWIVTGNASATGFPEFDVDCMAVFTLPLEGGTASTTCPPSDVTFTVGPAPGGTFEVSGLGNGTFDGVVCIGGAGGSSLITEGPTSFSAGGIIEGTVTCGGFTEIPVTGSFSAEADK